MAVLSNRQTERRAWHLKKNSVVYKTDARKNYRGNNR